MTTPLLSVVIPTAGRPGFLRAAIRSALASGPSGEVEVLVVPNGLDPSWKNALEGLENESWLSVQAIGKAHANSARNHGLRQSKGKYVRFLDDDDELYGAAACRQLKLLESADALASSGSIDLVDRSGHAFKVWSQPVSDDFVSAMLSVDRTTHLAAHVFRRSLIVKSPWSEDVHFGQDTHWMLSLCLLPDFDWLRVDETTGFWRHHGGARISASRKSSEHYKASAQFVLATAMDLQGQGRLDASRRNAVSRSLWHSIHGAFFMDPLYWSRFMRKTTTLFPDTYPDLKIYRSEIGRKFPPLLLESVMVPKRWTNHFAREYKRRKGLISPW